MQTKSELDWQQSPTNWVTSMQWTRRPLPILSLPKSLPPYLHFFLYRWLTNSTIIFVHYGYNSVGSLDSMGLPIRHYTIWQHSHSQTLLILVELWWPHLRNLNGSVDGKYLCTIDFDWRDGAWEHVFKEATTTPQDTSNGDIWKEGKNDASTFHLRWPNIGGFHDNWTAGGRYYYKNRNIELLK